MRLVTLIVHHRGTFVRLISVAQSRSVVLQSRFTHILILIHILMTYIYQVIFNSCNGLVFYVAGWAYQRPPAESVFNMNCMEGPVSDSSAVIPDFEQCAKLIVVHRRRGDGGDGRRESMQLQRSHWARSSAETIDTELRPEHLKCKCILNNNSTDKKVVSVSWDLSRCIVCIYLWNQNLCTETQVPELAYSTL